MSRKVKYLRLHQNIFIPGVGDLGSVLPDPRKSFTVDMVDSGNGVLLDIKPHQSPKVEGRIPDGNIALIVYAPEEAKPASKK